jgi:hypothetical protein
VLASISNAVVTLAVTAVAPPARAGAFGLVMMLFLLALALGRAVGGDALLLSAQPQRHEGQGLGLALTSGVLGALVGVAVLLTLAGRGASPEAAWLLALMPWLVVQDTYRYVAFARHQPAVAMVGDAIWVLAVGLGAAVATLLGRADAWVVVALWAVGGMCSGAFLALRLRQLPDLLPLARRPLWDRRLQLWLLAEAALLTGPVHLVLLVAGASSGLQAVAALRLLQIAFAPMTMLFFAWYVTRVQSMVGHAQASPTALRTTLAKVGLALGAVCLLLAFALLALPEAWGRRVGGETFALARVAVVPFALSTALTGSAASLIAGLRACGALASVVVARVVVVVPNLVAVAALGRAFGITGIAWALVATNAVGVAVLWRSLASALATRASATNRGDHALRC